MLIYHLLTQASIPGVNYPLILSLCKTRLFYSLWPQSSPSSSDLNLIELYPCRYTFGKPVTGKVSINMNLVGIGYYDNYIGNNVYLFGEVRFLLSEDLLNSCHDIHQTLNKHWTGCWYLSVLACLTMLQYKFMLVITSISYSRGMHNATQMMDVLRVVCELLFFQHQYSFFKWYGKISLAYIIWKADTHSI